MNETTDLSYQELTATNLKEALWTTLQEVRRNRKTPAEADSIATQAREILRTVKTQLAIASQSKRPVPTDLLTFTEK